MDDGKKKYAKIKVQADDFFNAFRILNESDKVLMERLSQDKGTPIDTSKAFGSHVANVPSIVCLSFALELYLKALIYLTTKKSYKSHNILNLFNKLPNKEKMEIFEHKKICENPFITRGAKFSMRKFQHDFTPYEGFKEQLASISKAFQDWRYSHEKGAVSYDVSLALTVIEAIKSATNKAYESN